MADFAMLLLAVISAFLILVVLLQRGRGGGLAGAFGGLGGQSAFGTKAGDVFTKITIGLVTAWVLLAGISGVLARRSSEKFTESPPQQTDTDDTMSAAEEDSDGDAGAEGAGAGGTGADDTEGTGGENLLEQLRGTEPGSGLESGITDPQAPEDADEPASGQSPSDDQSPSDGQSPPESTSPDGAGQDASGE